MICRSFGFAFGRQHFLYFIPLPQLQSSFRPSFGRWGLIFGRLFISFVVGATVDFTLREKPETCNDGERSLPAFVHTRIVSVSPFVR
jgi:hypothetical protein